MGASGVVRVFGPSRLRRQTRPGKAKMADPNDPKHIALGDFQCRKR